VYNQSDASILSNLPEGCIIAVKEPFYKETEDHGPMICVDHPSDIVLLRFNDSRIPKSLQAGAEIILSKQPEEWKASGDEAFIAGDFPTAVFW